MPNHDGGHYFLTVLAPVRTDTIHDPIPGRSSSHRHRLATDLALLPTGRQTAVSPKGSWDSPFSKNLMNHFVRLAIIQQPAFNGRLSGDTLLSKLHKIDPLKAQPVDRLTSPYLLFSADIDAPGDGEAALRAYADELWRTIPAEITRIFSHCQGFEGVSGGASFYAYLKRCQVETTMPFNDYWLDGLSVPNPLPKTLAVVAVAALAVIVLTFMAMKAWGGLAGSAAFIGLLALALWGARAWVLGSGAKPFPTAPGADLPTVLKALMIQQTFSRFAIDAQGVSDADLHARFGDYLAGMKPAEAQPHQPAGEVSSPPLKAAT